MDKRMSVYTILQNKIFLNFNEWLECNGFDFVNIPEQEMNKLITIYTHFIQSQLIDLMDQYRNAD